MIIAIHQPNFIPWLGYFYKINHCDLFVLLDDVQYTKNSLINRNRIKSNTGEQWVTMPVLHSGSFGQSINETHLLHFEKHYSKFLRTLQMNYSKAPFVEEIVFRKAIFSFFKNDWLALLTSTLAFALIHVISSLDFIHIFPYLAAGFIFSLAYILSKRNIWVTIIAHSLINLISFIALVI